MLFNSLSFLILFPIVVITYWLIPQKARWIFLLFASYYFYMSWNPTYALLMLTSTVLTYLCGLCIGKCSAIADEKKQRLFKKLALTLCIVINLSILFFFKYFNFFAESLGGLFSLFGITLVIPALDVLLPVGISFYTFQALGYSIDVYRNEIPPEKNLGKYALFVSFFPQLVAGPIERSKNLLTQIHEVHTFDYDRMVNGLSLMLWGLFQKVVIADRVAIAVNTVYNNCGEYTGIPVIIATMLFSVQIYCDFSGYSNIAIGAARVMGFQLMDNFNRPYFSKSVTEFWRRWHISLSTWFKDYIYIPLGGSRCSKLKKYRNVMITFMVSGLWHGANMTFVVWGALHGIFQIIEGIFDPVKKKINSALKITERSAVYKITGILFTYLVVDFAWIFFRANNMADAIHIISSLFVNFNLADLTNGTLFNLGIAKPDFIVMCVAIAIQFFASLYQRRHVPSVEIQNKALPVRWIIYLAAIFAIIIFGAYGPAYDASSFIYFQF